MEVKEKWKIKKDAALIKEQGGQHEDLHLKKLQKKLRAPFLVQLFRKPRMIFAQKISSSSTNNLGCQSVNSIDWRWGQDEKEEKEEKDHFIQEAIFFSKKNKKDAIKI